MYGKMKLDQETEDWLLAFLNGELDERRGEEVERWIARSESNREVYEALLRDYLYVRWAQENACIQEERAKKVIFSSLKKKKTRWLYYGVAASIAVLLTVTIIFFGREKSELPIEVAEMKEKPMIRQQAVLVLSTGEEIQLTRGKQEIQEQDGSVVSVDSTLGIHYDADKNVQQTKPIYNKIIVPRGGEYFVTLSEGTQVWLDSESELEYPVVFSGDYREVRLKGEGYFVVTKDTKPFRVRVGEYSLKVYGTEFNINAYDLRQIETVLVKGSVGFKANVSSSEQMMHPNELAISDIETGVSKIRKVDVYPYVAWKNQTIVFENECLDVIMEKLSRWYDVNVFFQSEELKSLRFDCNMQRYADIGDLLVFMEKTSNARFTLKGRTIVVSKK